MKIQLLLHTYFNMFHAVSILVQSVKRRICFLRAPMQSMCNCFPCSMFFIGCTASSFLTFLLRRWDFPACSLCRIQYFSVAKIFRPARHRFSSTHLYSLLLSNFGAHVPCCFLKAHVSFVSRMYLLRFLLCLILTYMTTVPVFLKSQRNRHLFLPSIPSVYGRFCEYTDSSGFTNIISYFRSGFKSDLFIDGSIPY